MSTLPSITASGLGLLERADQRLAQSAQTFTRGAAAAEPSNTDAATAEVVDAALGVIYGRSTFEMGLKLIAVGRDTEKALLDVLA